MKLSCRKKIWLYVIHIISDFIEGNSQICSRRRLAKKENFERWIKAQKKIKSIYPIKGFIPQSQMKKRSRVHKVQKSSVIWDPNAQNHHHPRGRLVVLPFCRKSLWNISLFSILIFTLKWCAFHGSNNRIFQVQHWDLFFFFNRAAVGVIDEWCWIFLVLEISFGISVCKWGIYANDACHHSLRVHFYNLFRIKRHALLWCCSCSCHPHYSTAAVQDFHISTASLFTESMDKTSSSVGISLFNFHLMSESYPCLLLPLFVTVNHKQIQLSLGQQQSHYFFFFYL